MSEYQYVAFRSVDRPLTDEELAFAETQSSRANITRWSFTNEYHYGDFRGDSKKLLRNGYDVHLHYANFGVRIVMLRLTSGLPFPRSVWSPYIDGNRVAWCKDKRGPGGILTINPYTEPGAHESIMNPEDYVDDLVELRNELLNGDLRTLFAIWLCGTQDGYCAMEDSPMPPVPAGIGEASIACQNLLELYDLDPLFLTAAGEHSLPAPAKQEFDEAVSGWVAGIPEKEARDLLTSLLSEDAPQAKAKIISRIRKKAKQPTWPTSQIELKFEELENRAEELRADERARENARRKKTEIAAAKKREEARQARMKIMTENPKKWLSEADKLVAIRGTASYQAAAEILADLAEAIGGEKGTRLVRKHAAHLADKFPTLNLLKSSLRKRGLLN